MKVYIAVCILLCSGCFARVTTQSGKVERSFESVKVGIETIDSNCIEIKRANKNEVVLSFFEEFNDSLIIYQENNKVAAFSIYQDPEYVSSGYSGRNLGLDLNKDTTEFMIHLHHSGKWVKFNVCRKYPLYSLQRYDSVWYVNARLCVMNIK